MEMLETETRALSNGEKRNKRRGDIAEGIGWIDTTSDLAMLLEVERGGAFLVADGTHKFPSSAA